MNSILRLLQTQSYALTGRIALCVGCCLWSGCASTIHLGMSHVVVEPKSSGSADDTSLRSETPSNGVSLLRQNPLRHQPVQKFSSQLVAFDSGTFEQTVERAERLEFDPIGQNFRDRPSIGFSHSILTWDFDSAAPTLPEKSDEPEALRLWSVFPTDARRDTTLFVPMPGRCFSYTLFQHHLRVTPVSWVPDVLEVDQLLSATGPVADVPCQPPVAIRPTTAKIGISANCDEAVLVP